MIEYSKSAQEGAVLDVARRMCAAIRTAPKARHIDHLDSCIITGAEKDALVEEMIRLGKESEVSIFTRDAQNARECTAIVLAGYTKATRGMQEICGYCGFENCAECARAGGACVYDPIDLGIALGSAVSLAADARIDNRIMFTIGRAALSLGLMDKKIRVIFGIPLSATGKSLFFDRGLTSASIPSKGAHK